MPGPRGRRRRKPAAKVNRGGHRSRTQLKAAKRGRGHKCSDSCCHFRALSLNVLAENCVSRNKFPHVPDPAHLEYAYRLARLRERVAASQAHVVCLQEVNCETVAEDWALEGYAVVPQGRRTKKHTTGCAILYRTDRFELVWTVSRSRTMAVELRPLRAAAGDCTTTSTDAELSSESADEEEQKAASPAPAPPATLYVASCHLEGAPWQAQLRTNQLVSLFKHLERRQLERGQDPAAAATVVCGDFNSGPADAAYRFVRRGALEAGEKEREDGDLVAARHRVEHPYRFRSGVASVWGAEPRLTFCADPATHAPSTIDFVFYNSGAGMAAEDAMLQCPLEAERACVAGLPSAEHGSDHLPVWADLVAP